MGINTKQKRKFSADWVTFTDEILNEKLRCLCSANIKSQSIETDFFQGCLILKKKITVVLINETNS